MKNNICKNCGPLEEKDIGIKPSKYKEKIYPYKICKICYRKRNKVKNAHKPKKCITCKKILDDSNFSKCEINKEWRTCKDCKKQYGEKRKTYQKNIRLIAEYGITIDEYNIMLSEQKNVCRICKKPENIIHYKSKMPKELSVDHCHKTGRVRGLLCSKCNIVIGNALDDISILESAILYLKEELGK